MSGQTLSCPTGVSCPCAHQLSRAKFQRLYATYMNTYNLKTFSFVILPLVLIHSLSSIEITCSPLVSWMWRTIPTPTPLGVAEKKAGSASAEPMMNGTQARDLSTTHHHAKCRDRLAPSLSIPYRGNVKSPCLAGEYIGCPLNCQLSNSVLGTR